jgi:hypothetical protein
MASRQNALLANLLALGNVQCLPLKVKDIPILVLSGTYILLCVTEGTEERSGGTYRQTVVNHNVDRFAAEMGILCRVPSEC